MRVQVMTLVAFAVMACGLSACGESSKPAGSTSAATGSSAGSPAWVLAAMPEGAVDVAAAKPTLKEGDTVVVRGRIGGRRDPVSAESAVFVMMDPAIPSCDAKGDDHCSIPWDYCCETPETISANIATVQVVDASGTPVASSVEAFGFHPLDTVVVVGTVGARPDPKVLTIKATGVHKVGG